MGTKGADRILIIRGMGMKNTKEGIKQIANFVYEYMMKTGEKNSDDPWGPKYRWEHTLHVSYWAKRLAIDEGADFEKCVIAALFHDVSHFVSEDYRQHGVKSAEVAKKFLAEQNYPENIIEDVAYAVKSHVGESSPRTIEAKILQDADTLDRFGYFRILLFGKTADVSNLEKLKEKVKSSIDYLKRLETGEFGPMWTKIGKAKLKGLLEVNRATLEGVLEELENTKPPLTG